MPLIKSRAKAIGKQALKVGFGFASDVLAGKDAKKAAVEREKMADSSLLRQAAYRSYIETLLSFEKDAKDSQLLSVLWYQNSSGAFDTRGAGNTSYTKRKTIAAQSHEFDMMGRLHLDMIFQSRYVLNGIEIKYRLIRVKDSCCLHENADQAANKVSLKEVSLFCRKVKPNPSIQLAHAKALQHGTAK